ncbi:40S ribosomal protein S27.2 isoform X1 [Neoarius graeffei]|uniref:40S ribosomal protein S27.2 isoform X1 n=1 Tax=Neoarius graeffei TaxID=443677 RepID=UPI00298D0A63|nr:40S ribosomal protein S27.2 isoform X1 [Neoarius graeffei]
MSRCRGEGDAQGHDLPYPFSTNRERVLFLFRLDHLCMSCAFPYWAGIFGSREPESQSCSSNGRWIKMDPHFELARDLLHPSAEDERRRHKKKRLVQSPNSYFMDVKCPGCYKITTVFSHAQTVVLCVGCSTVLCQPTGGKARLTEGCSFRRKQH